MPRWILVIFAAAVMLSGTATAGPAVAPNDVCIYEHVDYIGWPTCFSLEPGMRHKLVPTLDQFGMNDRASSVQVGEGVNVVIYEHARFGGRSYRHDISVRNLMRPEHPVGPWVNFNDIVSSMIIVPRQTLVSGVELLKGGIAAWAGYAIAFYPLPERLNDLEARYPNLHWMDMNDKANMVRLHGDVKVTLYEHDNFNGKELTLLGVGSEKKDFNLRDHHFGGIASSLVVRKRGTQ